MLFRSLNLQGNSCCKGSDFIKYVLITFPSVRTLNGVRIKLLNDEVVAIATKVDEAPGLAEIEIPVKHWV